MAARAGKGYEDWIDEERAEARMAENEASVRAGFWGKLKRAFARIPFAEELVAAYYCALDDRTPMRVRAVLLGALAYFILPFDVIPDVILGLGFTDDITVLFTAVNLVASHIKPEHRHAAREALRREAVSEA